jgi:antitoxin YobK
LKISRGEETLMREELTAFIEENVEDDDFTGGVSVEEAAKIEEELGVVLPQSYRWFLSNYGSGGLFGSDILGCGKSSVHRLVSVTAKLRQEGLPNTYIAIEDCDEFYYCLDLSDCSEGECSIIAWDRVAGFSGKRADTFYDFLLTRFTEAKEMWDEDI